MTTPRDPSRPSADPTDEPPDSNEAGRDSLDDPAIEEEEREAATGAGDAPMRASIKSVFFCGLCFAVVGFAVGGLGTGFGVAVGGLIATANLWVFAKVGQAFVGKRGNTAPWGVIALLKMLLLFGGVWLILRTGVISALSLILGYLALPIGVTVGSLFGPSPRGDDRKQTPHARRDENVIQGARAKRKDLR
jgi:hypothetical protein